MSEYVGNSPPIIFLITLLKFLDIFVLGISTMLPPLGRFNANMSSFFNLCVLIKYLPNLTNKPMKNHQHRRDFQE